MFASKYKTKIFLTFDPDRRNYKLLGDSIQDVIDALGPLDPELEPEVAHLKKNQFGQTAQGLLDDKAIHEIDELAPELSGADLVFLRKRLCVSEDWSALKLKKGDPRIPTWTAADAMIAFMELAKLGKGNVRLWSGNPKLGTVAVGVYKHSVSGEEHFFPIAQWGKKIRTFQAMRRNIRVTVGTIIALVLAVALKFGSPVYHWITRPRPSKPAAVPAPKPKAVPDPVTVHPVLPHPTLPTGVSSVMHGTILGIVGITGVLCLLGMLTCLFVAMLTSRQETVRAATIGAITCGVGLGLGIALLFVVHFLSTIAG